MADPGAADLGGRRAAQIALAALSWLAGCAAQLQQAALWPTDRYAALAVSAAAVLAVWTVTRRWTGRRGTALLALAVAALAGASTGLRATARLADALDPALEGRDLVLVGVVAGLPQNGAAGLRFSFEVEQAQLQGRAVAVPRRIALGWYRGFHDEAGLADPWSGLRAGQRWRLPVRLKQPHGTLNPDGFDAELWWWEQGLRATGYVRVAAGGPQAAPLAEAVGHPVDRLRQRLRDAIDAQVADARSAGVLAALVVGDQAAIEREDWELFRRTGIAHLVSISGVHVTMFAWLAGLLIAALWGRRARLPLVWPAPSAGRLGGLLVAAAYALLAGWGVPAQRTVLMLAIGVLLRAGGLRWPWTLVLLLAAAAVTLADPWALLQPGFWLSFVAVGLLLASEPAAGRGRDRGWRAVLGGHLRSQAVATLGLAPLSLVFFQQLSLVGFVANLVAIPWVTLLLTPLALLGALWPPLWTLSAWALQALLALLQALSAGPLALWTAAAAPGWAVACGLVGALLGVLPLPWALRLLALPLLLPLLAPPLPRPAEGRFELLAADVGQGTAVLLRTRGHLLVYDAGPLYARDSDAGQRVLLPLLRARGEARIDRLVLSHRDSDHVGGAATLLAALPVALLSSSLPGDHPLRRPGLPHQRCEDGQAWTWDGVRFEFLHPTPAEYAAARKPNAVSCVLRVVDARGRSALLTGDIEAAQESALLARHGAALASTILLVPHHGSRTSSSAAFVAAVRPQWAVVQAGYRSRFGHPAADIIARYAEQGIEVVRSDRCGAWLWRDGAPLCTRDVRRRYWHWTAPGAGAVVANLGLRQAGADHR